MSFLVHIRKDGCYWSQSDHWAPRLENARNFESASEAERFCRASKLNGAEIFILRDGHPPVSIPIPIRARAVSG
jgi:hypothetical protein